MKNYMHRDIKIECWTRDHIRNTLLIGIPIGALWIFGFPIFIIIQIKRR